MIPKFRAWDKTTSKLHVVNGIYCDNKKIHYIDDNRVRFVGFDNVIIMQSTGLLDKNGKEIFEGDIVDYKGRKAVIKWHGSYASFIYIFVDELQKRVAGWSPLYLAYFHFEVIGNKFETPEFLEVKE